MKQRGYERCILVSKNFKFKQYIVCLDEIAIGSGQAKTCLLPYANNKGADQPAHPRSLISTFIIRSLDSIISLVSRSEISRF